MWLGPNGLPISPRKQRGKLFEFCTTHFVTEAEMRYCFARLLSVGNPSGPVKYAGQPQYDSEQVVSPLFTFAMPAAAPPPSDASDASAPPPPPAAAAPPVTLSAPYSAGGAQQQVSLASYSSPSRRTAKLAKELREQEQAQAAQSAASKATQSKLDQVEHEVAALKAQLHALAEQKARRAPTEPAAAPVLKPAKAATVVRPTQPAAAAKVAPATKEAKAAKAVAAPATKAAKSAKAAPAPADAKAVKPAGHAAKPATSSTSALRAQLSAAAAALSKAEAAPLLALPKPGINSVFYLPSAPSVSAAAAQPWFHKQRALAI